MASFVLSKLKNVCVLLKRAQKRQDAPQETQHHSGSPEAKTTWEGQVA